MHSIRTVVPVLGLLLIPILGVGCTDGATDEVVMVVSDQEIPAPLPTSPPPGAEIASSEQPVLRVELDVGESNPSPPTDTTTTGTTPADTTATDTVPAGDAEPESAASGSSESAIVEVPAPAASVSNVPKTVAATGRLNNDPAFTDNATDIATALDYEEQFYAHFSSFVANVDTLYRDQTNAHWFGRDYSGIWGVRFYHLYDDMFSLGKVLRITKDEKPAHHAAYKAFALRILRESVDAYLNLEGLEDSPFDDLGLYRLSPDWWRFLDATRGAAWMAYLMDSILYSDSSYQTEFSGYADKLIAQLDPYLEAKPPVAHMASHPALAAFILGKIGTKSNTVNGRIETALTTQVADRVAPWDLTDISHAAQSEQALFYVYESNLRGESLPGLASIDKSLITALANGVPSRMNDSEYAATVSPYTESYGELVKFNSGIADHVAPASGYGNSNSSYMTLAHLAYGYAINIE